MASGRVRHLTCCSASRRLGVGEQLVARVIDAARGRFGRLRLSTQNPAAARLYERMGFSRSAGASDRYAFPGAPVSRAVVVEDYRPHWAAGVHAPRRADPRAGRARGDPHRPHRLHGRAGTRREGRHRPADHRRRPGPRRRGRESAQGRRISTGRGVPATTSSAARAPLISSCARSSAGAGRGAAGAHPRPGDRPVQPAVCARASRLPSRGGETRAPRTSS